MFVRSRWQPCVQEFRCTFVFDALLDGGVKDSVSSTRMGTRQGHATMRPALQRNKNSSIQTCGGNLKSVGENVKCYYCNKHHKLESCDEFRKLPGEENIRCMCEKKLCDNFLSSFHFSRIKRKHLSAKFELNANNC